jgi:uncharacterized protein (TIGR01777 family)
MSSILITGGTGLLGSKLTQILKDEGHEITILTRTKKTSDEPAIKYAEWNVKEQTIDEAAVASADFIIHLAGASVADKRWSDSRKKEIIESRTHSSALLVKALQLPNKVKAIISASAIGWYGPDEKRSPKKKVFTEDMRADKSFLGETCRLWEESIEPVIEAGKRLVKLRIGIVLSNDGGALPEFKKPVKFGIAGVLGSGKQVVSWIHINDICRMIMYAIDNESLEGAFNAVAPSPVTNKELTLSLAKKMKGNFYVHMHIPVFLLKAMMGEMSAEVLKSATVSSEKIKAAGFTFLYPSIDSALDNLIR